MATPTAPPPPGPRGLRFVGEFLHASFAQNPELGVRASPVTHIKTGGPLILLLHGTADESVQSESSGFAELYREAGVQLDQVLIQGASACGSKEVVH
jgi:hypothetical protein